MNQDQNSKLTDACVIAGRQNVKRCYAVLATLMMTWIFSAEAADAPISSGDSALQTARVHKVPENQLATAIKLEQMARNGKFSDPFVEQAAKMLDHEDLFVRAMAEWALARKVGRDNNYDKVVWTEVSDKPWFKKWMAIPKAERVEMDWCRQAVSLGIYNDAKRLKAALVKLGSNAASNNPAELRLLYIKARRANRAKVFAKANLDFDEILLYNRYASHHKPNVCGVDTSWVYKPGGDIVVVSGLEKVKQETSLIKGKVRSRACTWARPLL